MLQMLEPLLWW